MSAETLARWQFAVTTIYHYLFVPLTIGLSMLVAGMQTAWYRTNDPRWKSLTKFFGKLFLINFAMGVVTGIVQEFQFGMNWSSYSRFVGDVFGAPLAMEGLLAFFLDGALGRRALFPGSRVEVPLAAVAVLAPAAIEEYLQRYSVHRTSSVWDFAADLAGVVVLVTLSRRAAQ